MFSGDSGPKKRKTTTGSGNPIRRGMGKLSIENVAEKQSKLRAFLDARKAIKERVKDISDKHYYGVLVFQSESQKLEFFDYMKQKGVDFLYGIYCDAETLCKKLDIPITPCTLQPRRLLVNTKLAALTLSAERERRMKEIKKKQEGF